MLDPFPLPVLGRLSCIAAVLLGMPSTLALVLAAVLRVQAGSSTDSNGLGVKNPDAILLMLDGITRVFGALGGVISTASRWFAAGLGIVGVLGLALATLLWFTGKGLQSQAEWARLSAAALSLAAVGLSLVLTLTIPGLLRLVPLVLATTFVLVLYALWQGYAH